MSEQQIAQLARAFLDGADRIAAAGSPDGYRRYTALHAAAIHETTITLRAIGTLLAKQGTAPSAVLAAQPPEATPDTPLDP